MGPTRGARDERAWQPNAGVAFAIRLVALVVPIATAVVAIRLATPYLFRPDGWIGLLAWVGQAAVLGALVSRSVDVVTRRLLPLAALFNLSLVFPDRAPSRFGVALRAGTIRRLRERAGDLADSGLVDGAADRDGARPEGTSAAARRAIELVLALGRHDRLTRGHTERVRAYADLIGAELGLDEHDRNLLSWGVILHDVGKVTVPPEILNKAGRPTEEEWEILAGHPAAGARMLEPLAGWLGEWRRAAGEHHERWDGTGYPNRLAGNRISLAGRIAAVADAFDVITSKRSYKKAMTNVAARRELVRCAGTQFDPAIVRAFLNVSLGRRRPAGGGAWLGDSQLWGSASSAGSGAVAATAASVGVALGTGSPAGAEPSVDRQPAPVVTQFDPVLDESGVEDGVPVSDAPVAIDPHSVTTEPVRAREEQPAGADDGSGTAGTGTAVPPTTTTSPPGPTTTSPPPASDPTNRDGGGPTTTVPDTTTTVPTTTVPPTTVDPSVVDLIDGSVDQVSDVVEPVVDTVDQTVDGTVDQTVDTTGSTLDTVDETLEPVTGTLPG